MALTHLAFPSSLDSCKGARLQTDTVSIDARHGPRRVTDSTSASLSLPPPPSLSPSLSLSFSLPPRRSLSRARALCLSRARSLSISLSLSLSIYLSLSSSLSLSHGHSLWGTQLGKALAVVRVRIGRGETSSAEMDMFSQV